jgi:cellobiose phosphorylase
VATYKIEPYVMAADVYAVSPHAGRGGWSWYTGSAGWMYRLLLESLLGLTREGDRLRFSPCLPAGWDTFSIRYRHGETFHDIRIERTPEIQGTRGDISVSMDGVVLPDATAPIAADGLAHEIVVGVPSSPPGRLPP